MKKSLYMETTKVSVAKTCAEIEEILIKHGVKRVWKDIEDGHIEGIAFQVEVNGASIAFRLPFRWKEVKKLAESGRTGYKNTADEEQARRVAARIVLRWVEAQMALVDVNMASIDEIFLPYMVDRNGKTLYDALVENGGVLALYAGNSKNTEPE